MPYTPPVNLIPAWLVGLKFDGVDLNMQDLTLNEAINKYPRTGNLDAGATNYGIGEKTWSYTGTIIVDADNKALPATGVKKDTVATDGVKTVTGKSSILSLNRKGGGMGGVEYTISGEFAGTVAIS